MPSQPLVASIVLLLLCSGGYSEKLWIFIVELKQFLCSMYSLPGITTFCGGGCMVSFVAFKLISGQTFWSTGGAWVGINSGPKDRGTGDQGPMGTRW